MTKSEHDSIQRETEILAREKQIEKKVNYELIILIVMLILELPSFIFYLKALWK
tara:strand:- start:9442 stop:9603 length:162 start_codon:yes stop_codon:yes gene_type:complete